MRIALLLLIVLTGAVSAQQPVAQLSAVTYTVCSARTELFAEWRPFVVGQAT